MDLLFVYSGNYGERVIGNLMNYHRFCTVCDPACSSCRFGQFNWSSEIRQALIVPGPSDALPPQEGSSLAINAPEAEVAFLIDVHPEVMLDFVESLRGTRVRAVIVPIERPGIGAGLLRQVRSILDELKVELACPKPFCSLTPHDSSPTINAFIEKFRIGRPLIEVETETAASGEHTISKARVLRSSPCGATWYICRKLVGTRVEAEAVAEVVARAHHTYPCTASMVMDRETGDTFLHAGGRIARESVFEALRRNLAQRGRYAEAQRMADSALKKTP